MTETELVEILHNHLKEIAGGPDKAEIKYMLRLAGALDFVLNTYGSLELDGQEEL